MGPAQRSVPQVSHQCECNKDHLHNCMMCTSPGMGKLTGNLPNVDCSVESKASIIVNDIRQTKQNKKHGPEQINTASSFTSLISITFTKQKKKL